MDLKEAIKHLHNHPHMERKCYVDVGHVIIDKGVYEALISRVDTLEAGILVLESIQVK